MMPFRLAPPVVAFALLVGGCAAPQSPDKNHLAQYDLGAVGLAPSSAAARPAGAAFLPLLKIVAVAAPPALDSVQMTYRLVYADPRQVRDFAGSRWTARPAQLLTARLRDVLSRQARILDGGDPDRSAPLLKVVLLDFSQRFDAPGEGRGVVVVRASLLVDGHLRAQRDFGATVPSPTADAAGGATAVAAAADAVVGDIGAWLDASRLQSQPQPER